MVLGFVPWGRVLWDVVQDNRPEMNALPLDYILSWFDDLDEFSQFSFALWICGAVNIFDGNQDRLEDATRDYLSERLQIHSHIGRTIMVRAIVDWAIWRERKENKLEHFLDEVETAEGRLKSLMQGAIARHVEYQPQFEAACSAWSALLEGPLSDDALRATELELRALEIEREEREGHSED
jgi:hypothetical protein